MKERPILFSAPMVRALLDGRKTQTRRVVKDRHIDAAPPAAFFQWLRENCPYGQPGNHLWVRETFAHWNARELFGAGTMPTTAFRAGRPVLRPPPGEPAPFDQWTRGWSDDTKPKGMKWTPSIHMPRRASRLTLEITDVRVQRLNEITEADAIAEGATPSMVGAELDYLKHRAGFQSLWNAINGANAWDANPWVWALTFQRVPSNG